MKTVETGCFGITITAAENNTAAASIQSEMHDVALSSEHPFNVSVDALESLILAQYCAGIDITTPAYLQSIETAYEAIGAQHDHDDANNEEDVIYIQKTRNIQANVTESITYKVRGEDWAEAMDDSGEDEEQALLTLQNRLDVERVECEAYVDECLEEYDCVVTVI